MGAPLYDAERRTLSMALVGDAMIARALSPHQEPAFLALAEVLQSSDVTFANLETTVREAQEGWSNFTQGTPMSTAPELLEELRWMGVDVVSLANNHTTDYGPTGLVACMEHLRAHRMPYAGAGRTLMEARKPVYVDTAKGRVALVAATAFFRPWNRAADSRPDSPGRPGISPLGFSTSYTVDEASLEALRRASDMLGMSQERVRHRSMFYSASEAPADDANSVMFLGSKFQRGAQAGTTTRANKDDAQDILRWIAEARSQADWVIFSFHNHEFGSDGRLTAPTEVELGEPARFALEFGRQAVEAGADVVVGHGPHLVMGAEIHQGRPIFHSLGNFIFQNEAIGAFPAEAYARFGLGPTATPSEFLDARTGKDTRGFPASPEFWQGCAATCEFEAGRLARVRLLPLDLGHGRPRAQRGRPVLAQAEVADAILGRIERLSQPYGTRFAREGDTLVMRLPA